MEKPQYLRSFARSLAGSKHSAQHHYGISGCFWRAYRPWAGDEAPTEFLYFWLALELFFKAPKEDIWRSREKKHAVHGVLLHLSLLVCFVLLVLTPADGCSP